VVPGVPFGLLSSASVVQARVRFPMRRAMDALRAINELVFALVIVSAVGLGPLADVLALAVHTAGVAHRAVLRVGRADRPAPRRGHPRHGGGEPARDGLRHRSAGDAAPDLHRALPLRAEHPLGFVGAGGIGIALYDTMRSFDFGQVTGIMPVIILGLSLLDILSQRLQRVAIEVEPLTRMP
jgi:phosphonate transport system permease protein